MYWSDFYLIFLLVQRYVFLQAPTLEVKEFWVKEIKKVLMGQFDEIKSRYQSFEIETCHCDQVRHKSSCSTAGSI